ncbi:MAG: hypothetical protein ACE5EM_12415 [Sphingomonadales bacterium]
MTWRDDLISEIREYCRQAGLAETTFGRRAMNDGKFVGRLAGGAGITMASIERIRAYIRDNPPQSPIPE